MKIVTRYPLPVTRYPLPVEKRLARAICLLIVVLLFTSSCLKDVVNPTDSPGFIPTSGFTKSDTLDCDNQVTHEYDILSLVYKMEFSNALSAVKQYDSGEYFIAISQEIEIAASQGLVDWLDEYAGNYLSADLRNELIDSYSFIIDSAGLANFNSLIAEVITSFLEEQRFDLEEKTFLLPVQKQPRLHGSLKCARNLNLSLAEVTMMQFVQL